MSERSERTGSTGSPRSGEQRSGRTGGTGSPRSGEQLTGASPVGRLEGMHRAVVRQ